MKKDKTAICEQCSTVFIIGPGCKGRFCSNQCATAFNTVYSREKAAKQLLEKEQNYLLDPKTCCQCYTVLPYDMRMNKFCSKSCSAIFNNQKRKDDGWRMSPESKKKLSNSAKTSTAVLAANKARILPRIDKICPVCNNTFSITESMNFKIYCSKNCYSNDKGGKFRKKGKGGYREGSGRSKTGYYKGIYCGSTYELCWVIYRLDHNLLVQRFPGYILYDDNKKYYPDFLDGNYIYEMKGWNCSKTDPILESKTQAAIDAGYQISVLFKDDLQYAFDYVKETYHTSNFYTLYDEYKPVYNYICDYCSDEYSRDKPLKTNTGFCSRQCAGRARAVIKHGPIV